MGRWGCEGRDGRVEKGEERKVAEEVGWGVHLEIRWEGCVDCCVFFGFSFRLSNSKYITQMSKAEKRKVGENSTKSSFPLKPASTLLLKRLVWSRNDADICLHLPTDQLFEAFPCEGQP